MAAAVTAGWRVTRFVTHTATFGRLVCSATSVAATQGSMALPGVSATPIMSHPNRSAAAAMRSVRSTVNGQKKNPISTAAVLITPGMGEPSASGLEVGARYGRLRRSRASCAREGVMATDIPNTDVEKMQAALKAAKQNGVA